MTVFGSDTLKMYPGNAVCRTAYPLLLSWRNANHQRKVHIEVCCIHRAMSIANNGSLTCIKRATHTPATFIQDMGIYHGGGYVLVSE